MHPDRYSHPRISSLCPPRYRIYRYHSDISDDHGESSREPRREVQDTRMGDAHFRPHYRTSPREYRRRDTRADHSELYQ